MCLSVKDISRGDEDLLGCRAHRDIAVLGSCLFSIGVKIELKEGNDIT